MVCSPAGTTIEGVNILEKEGMRSAVMDAVRACIQKPENYKINPSKSTLKNIYLFYVSFLHKIDKYFRL